VAAKDEATEHDIDAEVEAESGDVLGEVLGWEFGGEEAFSSYHLSVVSSSTLLYQMGGNGKQEVRNEPI